MRIFPVMAITGLCLFLSACGAWQSVSDGTASAYNAVFHKSVKTLNIDLNARSALNNTSGTQPFSVAVRIYQLRDWKSLDAASYYDLLDNDRTVLGHDLQDMASVIVTPGGAVNVTQPMKADTQYVAVVAFFRDPAGGTTWRRVFPKKSLSADDPLKLELVGNDLVVAGDTQKTRPAP
ncbi:type VI secretion system protein VasD [Paraburkholderia bannensis]|uniref:Type VI secretion system protein VasD n=1 Tax=Paraburkholderia bannensis TaxID=765414 RepID=A0A7W9WU89_9BURK|nr:MULTISPECIES: type VI secretion system lipoprotein TssJ [Paraburkholderia]MBB3259383.1 type VI secretion system protein VasD [Paraburkholderia sp. WP4_3_2]MBB6104399.1 type VI secretion system protein VasD [Paraburkholderia bannensis]